MSDKISKIKKKNIILLLFFFITLLVGIYYIGNLKKDKVDESGSLVSGYILEDGAEPGLSEEEIKNMMQ